MISDLPAPARERPLHLIAFGLLVLAVIAFITMMVKEDAAYAAYSRNFNALTPEQVTAAQTAIEALRHATRTWLVWVLAPLDATTLLLAIRTKRRNGGASGVLVAVVCVIFAVALGMLLRMAAIPAGGA